MTQPSQNVPLELKYGCVIVAEMSDRNGIRKTRPGIVLTPTERISEASPLLVMAITTTFSEAPPPWHVPLPWNPDPGHVRTHLARRSAAVVTWVGQLGVSDVLAVRGEVPIRVMREIEAQLSAWSEQQTREGGH
jgi:mRNA-degrading endonuclease toxin of MazEF toxin-antitoxin module